MIKDLTRTRRTCGPRLLRIPYDDGGEGDRTAIMGGSDGMARGEWAPEEAVDFLIFRPREGMAGEVRRGVLHHPGQQGSPGRRRTRSEAGADRLQYDVLFRVHVARHRVRSEHSQRTQRRRGTRRPVKVPPKTLSRVSKPLRPRADLLRPDRHFLGAANACTATTAPNCFLRKASTMSVSAGARYSAACWALSRQGSQTYRNHHPFVSLP